MRKFNTFAIIYTLNKNKKRITIQIPDLLYELTIMMTFELLLVVSLKGQSDYDHGILITTTVVSWEKPFRGGFLVTLLAFFLYDFTKLMRPVFSGKSFPMEL